MEINEGKEMTEEISIANQKIFYIQNFMKKHI